MDQPWWTAERAKAEIIDAKQRVELVIAHLLSETYRTRELAQAAARKLAATAAADRLAAEGEGT